MDAYRYRPLKSQQVRRAVILPGSNYEPVRLKIDVVDLDQDELDCVALSYCWGLGPFNKQCLCDDGSAIRISYDLYRALWQLRDPRDDVALWVDQICINQEDDSEKQHQVRLMRSIYSRASSVVVWIGEEDGETELVFGLIYDVQQQLEAYIRSEPRRSANDRQRDLDGKPEIPLRLTSGERREWFAFRRMLSRSWFNRVWTFQELALAQTAFLRCGSFVVSWEMLYHVCYRVKVWDIYHPSDMGHLKGADEVLRGASHCYFSKDIGQEATSLENLMRMSMSRESSLAHDKVYGMIGACKEIDIGDFPIDYQTPVGEVFAYTTKLAIRQSQDLTILCLKRINRKSRIQNETEEMPSWVPDYRYPLHYIEQIRIEQNPKIPLHKSHRLYNATGSSKCYLSDTNGMSLPIQGVFVGLIVTTSDPARHDRARDQVLDPEIMQGGEWTCIAAICAIDGRYQHTNEPIEMAYARTRIFDHLYAEYNRSLRKKRPSGTTIPEPKPSKFVKNKHGEHTLAVQDGDNITRNIIYSTNERRLFLTDTNYMGLCHESCVEGDRIFLAMGSEIPYIVRHVDENKYRFQGEAYVHGIMEGEYLVKTFKDTKSAYDGVNDEVWLEILADSIPFPTEKIILV